MAERRLTTRELNRITLARQLLYDRAPLSAVEAVERLVGLQAQAARSPFVGLWTRLAPFARNDLASAIHSKAIVKATAMRATLHLLRVQDYVQFRSTLQPVLTSALGDILKQRGATVDVDQLVQATRTRMRQGPMSFAEITTLLTTLVPGGDPGAMRYTVRTHLPMVQVPTSTVWCFPGNPKFTPAETYLGRSLPDQSCLPDLILRYLAAFGPASPKDMQTWSYLDQLQPAFDELSDRLVTYADERGRTLYDVPGMDLAMATADPPIRFLPEFDNLLLAHHDRARVVPTLYRARVYLPGLRVAATVLVDGFVAGVWSSDLARDEALLTVDLFESQSKSVRMALEAEGDALLRFVEPDASRYTVVIKD
jgi:hypothetical protein